MIAVDAKQEPTRKLDGQGDAVEAQLLNDILFSTLGCTAEGGKENDPDMTGYKDAGGFRVGDLEEPRGMESEDELFNAFINTCDFPKEPSGSHSGSQSGPSGGPNTLNKHNIMLAEMALEGSTLRQPPFGTHMALSSSGEADALSVSPSAGTKDWSALSVSAKEVAGPSSESYYQYCERLLNQALSFGRTEPIRTTYLNPADFIDVDPSALPYRLTVSDIPTRSRVETQIKLDLSISPPPRQFLIHLPSDCITKQKLYLSQDEHTYPPEVRSELLYLEAFLLCSSNNRATYVCSRCVKREQRRAARRKSGLSDNLIWCNNGNRRAVVFNSKQVFLLKQSENSLTSKSFSLSTRIVCYCRHHKEPEGFKMMFILRDACGNVLGKDVTTPIMIMDKKSNKRGGEPLKEGAESTSATDLSSLMKTAGECSTEPTSDFSGADSQPCSVGQGNINMQLMNHAPILSPTSLPDDGAEAHHILDPKAQQPSQQQQYIQGLPFSSSSAAAAQRTSGYKRKRTWHESPFPILDAGPRPSLGTGDRKYSYPSASSVTPLQSMPTIQNSLVVPHQTAPKINKPFIHRVIPNQGPIKGGVEITLLGSNFKPGDIVKFGANRALSTQCWSDSTIVTYLPPAPTAGKVLVTVTSQDDVEGELLASMPQSSAFFTYVDDTDRQLIELALQIVGLKMNGKLEDARNIAKRIVGNDGNSSAGSSPGNLSSNGPANQFSNQLYYSDEALLIKVIKLLTPSSNISMCTEEGHTLLHLACLKGYYQLVSLLVKKGAHVEVTDRFGFTPLHFACVNGDTRITRLLIQCKAQVSALALNGVTPSDVFTTNHRRDDRMYKLYFDEMMDVLDAAVNSSYADVQRKMSVSSLQSSEFEEEFDILDNGFRVHVSKLAYDTCLSASELESSNYEEDGDDSLLFNDEASEHADASVESGEAKIYENQKQSMDGLVPEADAQPEPRAESLSRHRSETDASSSTQQEGSLWNRVFSAFNDSPPKYEDLFPCGSDPSATDSKLRTHISSEEDPSRVSATLSMDESQISSEDEEEALQARFNRFFQQRKNFRNDKMLLIFWIPLMIVLLSCFLINRFGQDGNSVHHLSEKASMFVRMGLVKLMLGNERMKTIFRESLNNFQSRRMLGDVVAI
ncbi:ACR165Wp [Eremothecium gossypii ATCC 10895]|uniref:ACR165Wp n=1 Tax=Eremothecium gossypii (strain ATCC 10895 / CBS 109.51 / FGSC 9923 / NRRL Y-1056) TaxID=284811 RepID=Q75BV6_EREGS|nr:ACR165Wp [Eremothecium gossypii ATCC 10895]AAS51391.1 ACR165Wp [Eremothecium gossypii ATCC 10895]AEY95682.1 FACR165Wp [Eremothecium gossypii FDAG1]